jgi:hypothetical protein
MELLNVKKVTVGDLVFYIRYSNRALLMYMNRISKEPADYDGLIRYFYDLSKAGAKTEGVEFNYTFEEFGDVIDPWPEAISNFNKAASELFGGGDEKKPKVK